ncbi:hypothetical protein PACTADRAFT_81817 [Pachysolen tannophilus NRRL Y-2460]|uniref:Uncharacterized protein n=1 Tax=Pachysolen tannophilus NRRL Y-2460 TaxID=669874 RepID=A0A1E4TR45_PACTA|nr:hypothetical protein PACTADRAFT_81817 [Pachysolen tannophilus NRRL Y-2460]
MLLLISRRLSVNTLSVGIRPFSSVGIVLKSTDPINTKNTIKNNGINSQSEAVTDKAKEENDKLLLNKYYRRTPNFLKPYVKTFIQNPIGSGVSFVILHEITAIVPFISLWWLFIHYDYVPFELPQEFVQKGLEVVSKTVMEISDEKLHNVYDKSKLIMAGANAYAATKMVLPLRIPLSVLLTPYMENYIVGPIGNLFKKNKNKKTPVDEELTHLPAVKKKKLDHKKLL